MTVVYHELDEDIDAYITRRYDESRMGKDIGVITRKRVPKTSKKNGLDALEVPDLGPTKAKAIVSEIKEEENKKLLADNAAYKKSLDILQKKFDAQTEIIKGVAPQINALEELHRDAAQRMEADTLDDVYGMGQISAEFKKLRANIDKFIPKEYVIDPTPYLDAAVARYKARTSTI